MTTKLVLMRHGQSVWNREDLFTGWTDVALTDQGIDEARRAGARLQAAGFDFDTCHTSLLTRAIKTLNLALEEMDRLWLPVQKSWRLNERHYGALQGLNKQQTREKHGEAQVHIWRRSYDIPPPALEPGDSRLPNADVRYRNLSPDLLPATESLKDTIARVLPYWHEVVAPQVRAGQRVLIAAHGNSLRGLVKYLSDVSDADIPGFELPTGSPLIYELDGNLHPVDRYFLD
jgi:2,3-bisphosphoglycerate-dependent phosphoglycerate mutase